MGSPTDGELHWLPENGQAKTFISRMPPSEKRDWKAIYPQVWVRYVSRASQVLSVRRCWYECPSCVIDRFSSHRCVLLSDVEALFDMFKICLVIAEDRNHAEERGVDDCEMRSTRPTHVNESGCEHTQLSRLKESDASVSNSDWKEVRAMSESFESKYFLARPVTQTSVPPFSHMRLTSISD